MLACMGVVPLLIIDPTSFLHPSLYIHYLMFCSVLFRSVSFSRRSRCLSCVGSCLLVATLAVCTKRINVRSLYILSLPFVLPFCHGQDTVDTSCLIL